MHIVIYIFYNIDQLIFVVIVYYSFFFSDFQEGYSGHLSIICLKIIYLFLQSKNV